MDGYADPFGGRDSETRREAFAWTGLKSSDLGSVWLIQADSGFGTYVVEIGEKEAFTGETVS